MATTSSARKLPSTERRPTNKNLRNIRNLRALQLQLNSAPSKKQVRFQEKVVVAGQEEAESILGTSRKQLPVANVGNLKAPDIITSRQVHKQF